MNTIKDYLEQDQKGKKLTFDQLVDMHCYLLLYNHFNSKTLHMRTRDLLMDGLEDMTLFLNDKKESVLHDGKRFNPFNEKEELEFLRPRVKKSLEFILRRGEGDYFQTIGRFYGYPECCLWTEKDIIPAALRPKIQTKVSKNGFIPCTSCAEKVDKGEVTLKDLLVDRESESEFFSDSIEESTTVQDLLTLFYIKYYNN